MIKNLLHIILIVIIITPSILLGQYTLDNTGGKINNMGTIRVKNGQTKALPDTIGGRMEFLQKSDLSQQVIPNIVYNQLVIGNTALKLISDERKDGTAARSLTVRDSLILRDTADFTNRWIGLNSEEVRAKSTVKNNAKYSSSKDMVLIGEDKAQDLLGEGSFSRLRVENKFGVDVRGGGFRVEEQLTLKQGELRNSATENFTLADTSRIIRYVGSSIAYEPNLEKQISVHYEGTGDITTGAEIPKNENALKNMYVNVGGKLSLDRNVSVVDTLFVGAIVQAIDDTLTLQGGLNPTFGNSPDFQIDGNFRRNTLLTGDTILLNAKSIWARFKTSADKGSVVALVSNVRAKTFHQLPLGTEKVERAYTLGGISSDGSPVLGGFNMDFSFGWRDLADQNINESNNLDAAKVVWQRWVQNNWFDIQPKEAPSIDFGTGWARGFVENLQEFGQFAIGIAGSPLDFYTFKASVFLEGPYIAGSRGIMGHELWTRNLIKDADLATYPTNLDKNIKPDFLSQIPDSVVDIVVIELRKERNAAPDLVKAAFLRKDGRLINNKGDILTFSTSEGIDELGGNYYVAIRHRNHAAIISEIPLKIDKTTIDTTYNFSDPSIVEGGTANLRLVFASDKGERFYALKGGFLADDAEGLNNQMNFLANYTRHYEHSAAWKGFTSVGYFNYDYNLSGISTTKDFNVSWNNRLTK
jgi:hypothetical protein